MNKFNVPLISLFLLLIITSCSSTTKVIAHRGFSDVAPENSTSAFNKAIDVGADYIELDVRQTKDSILVVIHDGTVDRTTSNNKTGAINELSYQEIKNFKVGYSSKFGESFKDEKFLTLEEALILAKNKIKVCVELKSKNISNEVIDVITNLDMIDQVIIFSFHKESILNVEKINPNIETLLLSNYANSKLVDYVVESGIDIIGVGYGTKLTKEFIKSAHKKNVKVFKWTVNKEDHMRNLIDIKIDGIITNRPDITLKLN